MPRSKIKNNSKDFLNPNTFLLEFTNSKINVSKHTIDGFNHSIKLHLSRKKIIHPLILETKYLCAFCNRPNNTWFFQIDIVGKKINIVGVDYKKPFFFCYRPGDCSGKKLNANSVEFVSATRKLSKEEALKFIHQRNSTPFYKENHLTIDEYNKYQGTRIFNKSEEEIAKIIAKQNFSRSLEGYIQRFGEADGNKRWHEIQKMKGITIENLERKHGHDAERVLISWKNKIGPSLKNFKNRYGPEVGLQKYRDFHLKIISSRANAYGYVSVEDGHVLRSNYERTFFNVTKDLGISSSEFTTDGFYPDSAARYDFYFPQIDLYIEIAGLKDKIYEAKLQRKIEKFNPLVLRPTDLKSNVIYDIVSKIKHMLMEKQND